MKSGVRYGSIRQAVRAVAFMFAPARVYAVQRRVMRALRFDGRRKIGRRWRQS